MDTELNRVPALDAQKLWCAKTPMGRLGNVNKLNGLAVYLASDASSFMTGTDVVIDVSTLYHHLPLSVLVRLGWVNCRLIFRYRRVDTAAGKDPYSPCFRL